MLYNCDTWLNNMVYSIEHYIYNHYGIYSTWKLLKTNYITGISGMHIEFKWIVGGISNKWGSFRIYVYCPWLELVRLIH